MPNTLEEIVARGIGECIEGVGLPVVATPLRLAMAEAALSALEKAGYVVVKVDEPLSEEEFKALLGITDLMRGVTHPQEPYTPEPGKDES